MNHLFNSCDWASQLWHWMENILGASDRNRNSIQETITNWRSNFSKVNRVNSIWKSAPGFIVWTIWKERNRRIFSEEIRSLELAQDSITMNIKQLIQVKCKAEADEKPTIQELQILKVFQLEVSSNQPTGGISSLPSSQISKWQCPPEGSLKLNFDGASRGNPGTAGIGGALRNQAGEIIHIFCRALGESTNNEAEFAALEQGLKTLRKLRQGNVIVEGDSLLAIMAAKRLQAGTSISKATRHWRLPKATESIAELIKEMGGLVFQVVRRKANGLADFLANHGADNPTIIMDRCWQEIVCPIIKVTCEQLAEKDLPQASQP